MDLIVKPIGLTLYTKNIMNDLRKMVLSVTKKVIYVIKEELRIFNEIRDAIEDAHNLNNQRNIEYNYQEIDQILFLDKF
jgi:hypothetical protein